MEEKTIYLPQLLLSPHYWLYYEYSSDTKCDLLQMNPFVSLREELTKIPELRKYIPDHHDEYINFEANARKTMPISDEKFTFGNGVTIMIDTFMVYQNIEVFQTAGYLDGRGAKFFTNLFNLYRDLKDYYK
jgi:hypothetical protein